MSDCKEFKGIVLVNLVRKVDFVRGYVRGCEIVRSVPSRDTPYYFNIGQ